ncbi:DUF2058 family protein [Dokdonella sp.]|uniref:DUF2058 family protein n=1 Tax=Dokdonella sp. TaxID=2291710 RepID=UPI0027B9B7A0|nr:DUF2058 family protein [Dokdonella sp.]
MSDSLRDQLLKAGFKPAPKAAAKPAPGRPQQRNANPGKPAATQQRAPRDGKAAQGDIDLAKAYALRHQREREDQARTQREAEARAKEKRERKQKLGALLGGAAQNAAEADIPRHFPHHNKIRRIYVTAEQLPRLNGGELAVVQLGGRYLLVGREQALAAQAIDPDALVLLCDAHAAPEDDVPADLVW